jgi:hypothetical protein
VRLRLDRRTHGREPLGRLRPAAFHVYSSPSSPLSPPPPALRPPLPAPHC